jgi:hypothetical protein
MAAWLGTADALAPGEQALSTKTIQAAVERHGTDGRRTEWLTRGRSGIASQYLRSGERSRRKCAGAVPLNADRARPTTTPSPPDRESDPVVRGLNR